MELLLNVGYRFWNLLPYQLQQQLLPHLPSLLNDSLNYVIWYVSVYVSWETQHQMARAKNERFLITMFCWFSILSMSMYYIILLNNCPINISKENLFLYRRKIKSVSYRIWIPNYIFIHVVKYLNFTLPIHLNMNSFITPKIVWARFMTLQMMVRNNVFVIAQNNVHQIST